MTAPVRILGIGGSIRADSVNRTVLGMMLGMAEELGAETVMADVHSMKLPIFDQELPRDQQPERLLWLIEEMQRADGFLICSPTYLGSLSGAVKNTLDSLHLAHGEPRVYFDGRPVALASFGFYGQQHTISSLAFVTRVMGAEVIPETVTISADEQAYDPDIIRTAEALAQMRRTMTMLIDESVRLRDAEAAVTD